MKRNRILIITAAVLCVAAAAIAYSLRRSKAMEFSGTVESRNIRVGSKVGGRISKVLVREGDRVEPGQVLVTFEEDEFVAALEQSRGQMQQAQANYDKMARGYRPEEIAEARAGASQAAASLEQYRSGYRTEEVMQVRADFDRAKAEAVNAERNYQRAQQLAREGVFSRQQLDDATAARDAAQAALKNAQERVTQYERGYRKEDVAAAEARFRQAEAVKTRYERGFRAEEIAASKAQLETAKGQLLEAESRYRERQVISPAAAVVEVLDIRPGDLISPNAPIAMLLERNETYVRVYVPETQFGRLKVGQKGEVRVDSFPKKVFDANIEQINQKAEFLPRNVQTKDERENQVVGVKFRIHDPEGLIRAGMAADVRVVPEEI
jgi:multidrug resistance efflux pump